MTALLVMTTGRTDVQVVVDGQRGTLDANTCGTLHDTIKERSWSVVDAPAERRRDIKQLWAGDLILCTPKLDAVLAHLSPSLPTSVLILETTRRHSGDPRFAGEVMERRLRDRGVDGVIRVAFLTGDEQLEDPSNAVDAVVRRTVVATLSKAIGDATAALKAGDLVFMATTGGLPAANALISELVRLHCVAGATVTALEVPDHDRAKQYDQAVEEKFHPAAGYSARWHALSLVETGSFLGAWGAVRHLEGAPGQEWTQVIEWLALFASALPLPEACDLKVLNHRRMAVRTALRVESALRAGDIPRAVHGTVAFFEAALWDWVRERDFVADDGASGGSLEHGLTFAVAPSGEKAERFQQRCGVWRINDFAKGIKAWLPVLGRPGLSGFWSALGDDVRNLRHDVAHNEPTAHLMARARTEMTNAGLWSPNDTFLSQRLVQDVLTELGVPSPQTLCTDLLADVRDHVVSV